MNAGPLLLLLASAASAARSDNILLLDVSRAGSRLVAVGERGAVLLSDDAGAYWRRAAPDASYTLTAVHFHDTKLGWAVGHDAVVLRTVDGGESWEKVREDPKAEKPLLDVYFADASRGFAVGGYGLFLESADGGRTWKERRLLEDDRHLNAIAGGPDGKVFIAGESGALLRSEDGGRGWHELASPYAGSFFGLLRLGARGLVLFGLRGKAFRSMDLGRSWRPIEAGSEATLLGGAVLADGRAVVVGYDGTVLAVPAGGASPRLRRNPDGKALSAAAEAGGSLVLVGEAGASRLPLAELAR